MTRRRRTQRNEDRWIWLKRIAPIATVIGVAGSLIMSGLALNQSAKTNSPQLLVLDARTRGFIFTESPDLDFVTNRANCTIQVRVANTGGAATSIVEFSLIVDYGDQELRARTLNNSEAIGVEPIPFGFTEVSSFFVPRAEDGADYPSTQDWYVLPILIEEHSTITLFGQVFFIGNDERRGQFMGDLLAAFGPAAENVEVTYIFELSDGESIETPPAICSLSALESYGLEE